MKCCLFLSLFIFLTACQTASLDSNREREREPLPLEQPTIVLEPKITSETIELEGAPTTESQGDAGEAGETVKSKKDCCPETDRDPASSEVTASAACECPSRDAIPAQIEWESQPVKSQPLEKSPLAPGEVDASLSSD